MKNASSPATAPVTQLDRSYYYRPLAFFGGKVFKCAGFGAENPEHRAFYTNHFNTAKEKGFLPGCVILEGYHGDRIEMVDGKPRDYSLLDS